MPIWQHGEIGAIVRQITEADPDTLTESDIAEGTSEALSEFFIGPDTIFTGKVELLDANIFKATAPGSSSSSFENAVAGSNMVGVIKRGIATTYVVLRNICAMIMLAGLIFTGIRVLITSNNPSKKAQWLSLVYDWLMGMILLIFSHVIMYGIFYISDTITDALAGTLMGFGGLNFSLVRSCLLSFDSAEQFICLVLLGYLIYLTVVFFISYFKRLLWVCVLIVIAPIVSIMYAFGTQTKQIYSKWIKEYITTVLVQPFHLIVYYTLVSVPLNMVSTSSNSISSVFTQIYALGAISFIRPAEKYIRHLFGMDQGLVEKASFDSGKKTLTEGAKKIGALAITAGSAGLGGAVMGALKSGQILKTAGGATKQFLDGGQNILGKIFKNKKGSDFIDNAPEEVTPNRKSEGFMVSRDPFHDNDDMFENDITTSPPKGMNKMNEEELQNELNNMGLEEGTEERAYMESELRLAGHGSRLNDAQIDQQLRGMGLEEGTEEYEEYANKFRDKGHGDLKNKLTEEQLQNELDNLGLERGSEERADYERAFRELGHGDIEEDVPPNIPPSTQEPNDTMVDEKLDEIANKEPEQKNDTTEKAREDLRNRELSNNINASNVNITAANITMQGKTEADKETSIDDKTDKKDSTDEATKKLDKEKEETKNEDQQKLENEKNIGIEVKASENQEEGETREKDDFFKRRKMDMNAARDFAMGESGVTESIKKLSPDSMFGKMANDFLETDLGKAFEKFEDLGGLQQLHEAFNTIRDGFFDGQAPGDWRDTNDNMKSVKEARIEQGKFDVCNNPENKNYFTQKYFVEYKEQYKDNKNYNDARLMAMAKDKADSKLKSLSDTYVPLGIKDPVIMLELEDDRKQFGMTPTEAIQQRVKYEKFNIDQKNISYINEHLNVNATSVKQAVEPAREYYNNGYQNVGDLSRVHELTSLLRVTPEFGMKLDKVLNKKGPNINLNLNNRKDLDDKQKDKIKTFIEDRYINNKETK